MNKPPALINPTPKQVVLHDAKFCSAHRDMASSGQFQRSLQVALAEYQRRLADEKIVELNQAAVKHFKVQGVHEFINTLMHLAEAPQTITPAKSPESIDHRV